MIQAISNLASAFGLSASAGLNAYLPLLIVALTARFTHLIRLNPPFDTLTNGWVILIIVLLLVVEIVADKIPVVDTVNDVVQTLIRPTAGAILFAAAANVITEVHPVLAMICGVIVAGSVHALKATARPAITASAGGFLNPVISAAEDLMSAVGALLAIVLPAFVVAIVVAGLLAFILWRRGRRPSSVGA